jgi:hypothetical protein
MSREAENDLPAPSPDTPLLRAKSPMTAQLQEVVGNQAMGKLVSVQRDPRTSTPAAFEPAFGGDAGVINMEYLNASIKLTVPVKNAPSAPAGTTMAWWWGAEGVDGVEKGDISPATGPTATFNAKARKPTAAGGKDELGANVEVTLPGQSPVVHPVSPAMRVGVMEPQYEIEQKVVPGASGGGSATALKPSDVLEFRVTFDNVDKPQELGAAGYLTYQLVHDNGLYLARLGGVEIPDDQPFESRPHRWEGDTLVYSVYCHHAGTGKYTLDFKVPGTKQVTKEFELKAETSLAFFLERCNAATERHRALLATFDSYIHQGFMNYLAGYNAAKAAMDEYAERQKLTREILLGILFAGLGGAAGGAIGPLVKTSVEQQMLAATVKSALGQAAVGAVTDAAKDAVKYTVRLGTKVHGSGGSGPTPNDATPETKGGGGTSKGVPGSVDPLNWYATIQKAKSDEEATIAATLGVWKTTVIDKIARGSMETEDFDPVNAMNDITKLNDMNVTELGAPPSAEAYEKNMWEAWIEKYAFTLKEKVGCGQWGYRVEDNVGKELHHEMERVAKVLAEKGIEASWLTEALEEAERIADEKARKSQGLL